MNRRKLGAIIFGILLLTAIGYTINQFLDGKNVGFTEIYIIALLAGALLSALTWGSKKNQDGILQNEELGQSITEKSSKISYYILTLLIIIAMVIDHLVNGITNIVLVSLLGLAVVLLPFVEYLVARRYQ